MNEIDRRRFLKSAAGGVVAVVLGSLSFGGAAAGAVERRGVRSYGPLQPADANGIRLPTRFRSRVVARSGAPVDGTTFTWHGAPDGGATFPSEEGGWIYVSNSERYPLTGGASALRFDPLGNVISAYPILAGTSTNCSGGATPWGTWVSCEEFDFGHVWECDPTGRSIGRVRPALGTFAHEAAAVDPVRGHVYLTEDQPDGRLYRFLPTTAGDLRAGVLEVAQLEHSRGGSITWHRVPNPNPGPGAVATRHQVASSTPLNGGEGCWYHADVVYVATSGDDRIWAVDVARQTMSVLYDAAAVTAPVLRGVDGLTVTGEGVVLVAEDGDDLQICALSRSVTGQAVASAVVEVVGQAHSEITGLAFSPDGNRLYFSSQRGPLADGAGLTYEISGPF